MAAEKKTVLGSNADKIVTGMDCPFMSWINTHGKFAGQKAARIMTKAPHCSPALNHLIRDYFEKSSL